MHDAQGSVNAPARDRAATVDEHLGRTLAEVAPALWPQLEPYCRKVLESGQPVLYVELGGHSLIDPVVSSALTWGPDRLVCSQRSRGGN